MRVVITSGYYDPLHDGHLEYFAYASHLAWDGLHVAIVNNNEQSILKKGFCFLNEETRYKIVKNLKTVDLAFISIDKDRTVCKTIEMIRNIFPDDDMIFLKGGDRNKDNIPESDICKKLNIKIIDNAGNKIDSSSNILNNYVHNIVHKISNK